MALKKIAVVDTTFSSIDMGGIILDQLEKSRYSNQLEIERVTVPGFKDIAACSRRLIDNGAEIVLAAGMPGPEDIDESCAKDASFGIQMVQAMTGVAILEIFVHMSEALDPNSDPGRKYEYIDEAKLFDICDNRCREHSDNALRMVFEPEEMVKRAGSGRRQGGNDVGPILK